MTNNYIWQRANGRAAMVGFLMLILTELVFSGRPVTSSIFGIN